MYRRVEKCASGIRQEKASSTGGLRSARDVTERNGSVAVVVVGVVEIATMDGEVADSGPPPPRVSDKKALALVAAVAVAFGLSIALVYHMVMHGFPLECSTSYALEDLSRWQYLSL
jgi:hypothetical protein